MPESSDIKRVAQAVVIIGDIRKLALSTYLEMTEDRDTASAEIKATLSALLTHFLIVIPDIEWNSSLGRHIHFAMRQDFYDMVFHDLPGIEAAMLKWADTRPEKPRQAFGFENLLHPKITKHSLPLYADRHYTDAVRNAYLTLFDEIRRKTKRTDDGSNLINAVFGLSKPLLVVGDLETDRAHRKGC